MISATSLRLLYRDRFAASSVELAVIIPVVLLILYGGIELSRLYYQENGVRSAASASIRHATNEREIIETDLEAAFFANLGTHDPDAITAVSFARSNHTLPTVDRLEVTVDYQFQPVTHLIIPADLDKTLTVKGLVPVGD